MAVLDELFVELHLFLRTHGINPNPMTDGVDAYTITKHMDFEPNGKASETWEYVWFLTFPWCRYYWRSTTGWRLGTSQNPIKFQAASLQLVIRRATMFLMEISQEGIRLGPREIYEPFKALSKEQKEKVEQASPTQEHKGKS
jgi:hypothetical protein